MIPVTRSRRQLSGGLQNAGIDMRPRRGPVRPKFGWEVLARTELRVVELIRTGRTNAEVAARASP